MNSSDLPEPTPGDDPLHTSEAEELSAPGVRDISIQQSIHHNVQLLFPSLIDAVGRLADSHSEIANKIVDDIIQQGTHRQNLEEIVVRGDNRRSTVAQILAWIFAMTALVGSILLIHSEQSTGGIVLIILALAPLVSVNVIGRRAARRERVEKAQSAHQPVAVDDL